MPTARGTFDVDLQPLGPDAATDGTPIGRRSINKTFHGDLTGTSRGQMLASGSPVTGSAGYVALEEVAATLEGRMGTFVLQHSASMNRGMPSLSITVVPDSGADGLAGITGRLDIQIEGGVHSYTFEYTFE